MNKPPERSSAWIDRLLFAAYIFSLLFTLLYGYWATKDRPAGRLLVPLLDILPTASQ